MSVVIISAIIYQDIIVKFAFRLKCRSLLQESGGVDLPTKAFRKSEICNFCSNVWMYGRCHVSVMPRKPLGRKMKKIIYKQEQSQALRPFEKKLFEKYKKCKNNKMVRVLPICLGYVHIVKSVVGFETVCLGGWDCRIRNLSVNIFVPLLLLSVLLRN
jgi:hypothetical protein